MESEAGRAPAGLREITREAVRQRIADVAIDLFAERGFDQVTVEQIAAEVGISARSFNRYFPTKEDAVLGSPEQWGALVRDEFADRPASEPVRVSLRIAFETLLASSSDHGERQKRVMRVLTSTASLRARNLEKHLHWARLLTPLVADRLGGDDATLRASVIVQAALACFDVALIDWAREDETRSPRELLAVAFSALE